MACTARSNDAGTGTGNGFTGSDIAEEVEGGDKLKSVAVDSAQNRLAAGTRPHCYRALLQLAGAAVDNSGVATDPVSRQASTRLAMAAHCVCPAVDAESGRGQIADPAPRGTRY